MELRAFLVVGDGGCFFVVVCTQGPVLVVSDIYVNPEGKKSNISKNGVTSCFKGFVFIFLG